MIEEPKDEIIEKLGSLKIEEASENDLVFDKVNKQLRQACQFFNANLIVKSQFNSNCCH